MDNIEYLRSYVNTYKKNTMDKMTSTDKMNRLFINYCADGNFEKAQQLYQTENINIFDNNCEAFEVSCTYNHIEIAKWLHSLGGGKYADYDMRS